MTRDKYSIVKGKALTMVREFMKVYPSSSKAILCDRITKEVLFAAYNVFGEEQFSRERIQTIYREVWDNVHRV